uniref:Putative ovule protein n=1 Tax=Solanum chacoense TaxID=4108 RepID=A0A0V0HI89_SOLCH
MFVLIITLILVQSHVTYFSPHLALIFCLVVLFYLLFFLAIKLILLPKVLTFSTNLYWCGNQTMNTTNNHFSKDYISTKKSRYSEIVLLVCL